MPAALPQYDKGRNKLRDTSAAVLLSSVKSDTHNEQRQYTVYTPTTSRVPTPSPDFVHDEFLFISVVINVDDRRAREHVLSVLQPNSIKFTIEIG